MILKVKNEEEKFSFSLSKISAILTLIISLCVLSGWIFHIEFLLNIYPRWITMKANTSICFLILGISIFVFSSFHISKPIKITITLLNLLLAIIATITLFEYIIDFGFSIDELIVKDYLFYKGLRPPGRMALLLTICFIIISICNIGIVYKKITFGQAQYIFLLPMFLGVFALLTYLYHAYTILFSQYLSISFFNATLLILSSLGLIFINPKEGWLQIALSKSSIGIFLRRILIINLFAFVILGYIREKGERLNEFDTAYGNSIIVASEIVIVTLLVIFLSRETFKGEQQLEASENKLRSFVQQVPSAIAMFDKNMHYLAASSKWLEDYDLLGKEVIGKSHYELFPDLSEDWKKVHQRVLQGNPEKRSRDLYKALDGSLLWLRWEARPWYNIKGAIGGITLTAENITDDVKQENDILSLNEKLKDLNEQKNKLFSIIAHDLKGPLIACNEFLTVVQKNKSELKVEELYNFLDELQKHASSTLSLVEELLLWGMNQMKQITFHPVEYSLETEVKKIFSSLETMIEKKEIALLTDIPSDSKIFADIYMLNAILRNLITNAIKFTLPGGWIKVSAKKNEDSTEISVQDNGVGIKEEDQQKLLNNIYGITTYGTKGEKGTGLGLVLCKDFIDKHGGRLSLKSKPGEGTTFSFTIPDKIVLNHTSKNSTN